MTWKTPARRSREYVEKIGLELGPDRIYLNKKVTSVVRKQGKIPDQYSICVKDTTGTSYECDAVVFACHPDQALNILGDDADDTEKSSLGSFQYSINDTYVHNDSSLMPRSKDAWTCWNYITNNNIASDSRPVFVTYWLNKLQNLNHPRDIFVSLNPPSPPAQDKTYSRIEYSHPQYTSSSVKAQRIIARNQGRKNTYFCG
jgi:predicted NAD/FAD-binding protein